MNVSQQAAHGESKQRLDDEQEEANSSYRWTAPQSDNHSVNGDASKRERVQNIRHEQRGTGERAAQQVRQSSAKREVDRTREPESLWRVHNVNAPSLQPNSRHKLKSAPAISDSSSLNLVKTYQPDSRNDSFD